MTGPALVLAVLAAATADLGTWQAFAPKGAGFRVLLPGRPSAQRSSDWTPLGRVVEHRAELETGAAHFWITWSDLPRLAVLLTGEEALYERVRRRFLQGAGAATEIGFGEIARDGRTGRELHYAAVDDHGSAVRGRLEVFLVGSRLLVFDATAPTDGPSSDVERFFASLDLD